MHCIIPTTSKHWNLRVVKREKSVGAFSGFESEDGEKCDKKKAAFFRAYGYGGSKSALPAHVKLAWKEAP